MAIEVDVQLGKQGRVVIPSNIRKKYELKDGDWVHMIILIENSSLNKETDTLKALDKFE